MKISHSATLVLTNTLHFSSHNRTARLHNSLSPEWITNFNLKNCTCSTDFRIKHESLCLCTPPARIFFIKFQLFFMFLGSRSFCCSMPIAFSAITFHFVQSAICVLYLCVYRRFQFNEFFLFSSAIDSRECVAHTHTHTHSWLRQK